MYRFRDCELDVTARELRRGGRVVRLEPQAFDLLVLLVERRHETVAKADLLDGVWGHRFLSEANLTTRVKEVRRAVGDDGVAQHTIRNVRGRGYRFVAEVVATERAPVPGVEEARTGRSLVGRAEELAAAVALLREHALVTLIGPGGVGKSTLALALVATQRDQFVDGGYFVELAGLTDADDLVGAVARDLDIVTETTRPTATLARIARLDALVVLDNCEHVAEHVGQFVDALDRTAGRRVRVLATSRSRIGVSAEHVVVVEPLGIDDGVELFRRRADATGRVWDVGVADERIAGLVDALDRLPLMIEMAAARLGSLSFDELEAAVRQGMPLLYVTHRAPAARHRNVESLVGWSVALLDAGERDTFASFGVFAGAVGAADAAAVVGASEPTGTAMVLSTLTDHSLLAVDADGHGSRYRMLATVRTVSRRRLTESGHRDQVERRHAEHAVAVARDIDDGFRGEREAAARARLDGYVTELRAAHRWAAQHDPPIAATLSGSLHLPAYWALWSEPAAWSQSLLSSAPAGSVPLHGAHLVVAAAAANRGDLGTARREATLAADGAVGRARATALEVLADVALYAGELDLMFEICDELDALGKELADIHARAIAVTNSTCAHAYSGRPAEALACVRALITTGASPTDRAWLVYAEGEALQAAGDADAVHRYVTAIDLASSVGNRFITSVASLSLATEHARRGDTAAALAVYAACLHGFERHGNLVHAVTTLRNLAELLVTLGDGDTAIRLAGATSDAALRPSYGAEAERLPDALGLVARQVGRERFDSWLAEGRALGLDGAVRLASERLRRSGG